MRSQHNLLLGKLGEKVASKYLVSLGYKIIERNFQKRYGEIDIVALESGTLAFVEVKTRRGNYFGTPEESITPVKLRRLTHAVNYYKLLHPELPESIRIDVVSICFSPLDTVEKIALYKNITL